MVRGIGWALLGLVVMQGAAQAQTATQTPSPEQGVPARIGNVYGGTHHEPNPSATQQQEQSVGVGLSQQQQQQQDSTIEQLDRQVQQKAATPTGTAAGCTANQKACPP